MRGFFNRFFIFSSIRSKLTCLLFILVGAPLFITGYLSYRSASEALLRQTTKQLGNLADKTAQQIDGFFKFAQKDINLLADYPFVQLAFLQYEFKQRLDTVERLLIDYSRKNAYFSHIYLIGPDGKTILSVPSDKTAHQDFSRAPWFIGTLEQGIRLSDVQPPESGVGQGIFLGKVVHDFENKDKPVGVLAFHINPSSYTGFAESLHVGSGGFAFLLHNSGRFIFHPDKDLRLLRDLTDNGDDRLEKLTLEMASAGQGHGLYSVSGQDKFLVFSRCLERPWIVGITVLQDELMVDINSFLKKMVTFLVMVILLILPISYLFIKGVTRPINQLILGVKRIGSGDLDQTIHIESNDELRAVAEEFNKMAARLKTSMDEIIDLKNFNDDILRNVTSGIITVDCEGRITSFNAGAARILQYDPLGGTGRSESPVPPYLQDILHDLDLVIKDGQDVQNKELAIVRSDRESAYLEVNTSLLASMTGKIFGAIADIRDITNRKCMEESMMRVEKLASLGELSAGMAHEIRNPLAGIKTSVQVLARRVSKPDARELLSGIESEINRLDKIVGDLLRFSRPASPRPEPLDIARVLEQTLDLMEEKIKLHHIDVIKGVNDGTPNVTVDQEQIRQVFLNLILNSIKAVESGGRILIDVHPAGRGAGAWGRSHGLNDHQLAGYVRVVFSDTGKGISPEHLPRVFDPFFSTDPKGTGLGLSIVHKLVEENNGRIFIESAINEGTRVSLLLPSAEKEYR